MFRQHIKDERGIIYDTGSARYADAYFGKLIKVLRNGHLGEISDFRLWIIPPKVEPNENIILELLEL